MLLNVFRCFQITLLILSYQGLTGCGRSKTKTSPVAPEMYFTVAGLSCTQMRTPSTSTISGTNISFESKPGVCPADLGAGNVILARCLFEVMIDSPSTEKLPQNIYYGKRDDSVLTQDGLEYWRKECTDQNYTFVVENGPIAEQPKAVNVPLNKANEYWSLEKDTYTAGETLRVQSLQNIDRIKGFVITNLSGKNQITSFNNSKVDTEFVLDPHLPAGIYEISSIFQAENLTFTSTGEFYWASNNDLKLPVLRFKVENAQEIDTTPPVLSSLAWQGTTLARGQKLLGSMIVSDALSGLGRFIELIKISGPVQLAHNYYPLIEGDTWKFEIDTMTLLPGTYKVELIEVRDKAGNTTILQPNQTLTITP